MDLCYFAYRFIFQNHSLIGHIIQNKLTDVLTLVINFYILLSLKLNSTPAQFRDSLPLRKLTLGKPGPSSLCTS